MKQVVFAIALLAMASLTGCLNTDDTSVDDNTDTTTDTTSDNTGNTNDDGTIEPVGQSGGYSPPETANITVDSIENAMRWVAKDGNRITTACLPTSDSAGNSLIIFDSDDRIIFLGNSQEDYGATKCDSGGVKFDVTLGPEPVKVGLTSYSYGFSSHYWIVTF